MWRIQGGYKHSLEPKRAKDSETDQKWPGEDLRRLLCDCEKIKRARSGERHRLLFLFSPFLLVPANWEPGTSWDLTEERVKIYRLVQLRNLNSNLISCKITFIFSMAANQRFKSRLSFTQMYLSMTKVNGTVSECQSGTNSVSIQERRLLQAQTSWTIVKTLLKGYLTGTRGEDLHPSSILSLKNIITNRFLS